MRTFKYEDQDIELRKYTIVMGCNGNAVFNKLDFHFRGEERFYSFPENGRAQKFQISFVSDIIKEDFGGIIRTESDIITTAFRVAVKNKVILPNDIIFLDANEYVDKYYVESNGYLSDYPENGLGETYSKLLDELLR